MKISSIRAREILDSRGYPTVEAEVKLEDGIIALGQVPSGESIGINEALELRDGDPKRFSGKGVLKAISHIKGIIKNNLVGQDAYDQKTIDETMIALDGTTNKSNLGANAILGVSLAICRASARSQKTPLYQYLGNMSGNTNFSLPAPLLLILEGGKHGDWSTDIQEYLIIPKAEVFPSFAERLRTGAEIFHQLGKILKEIGYSVGVGLEGAYMPKEISSNEEAFDLISQAVTDSGYKLGEQVVIGADGAASEFYENGKYLINKGGVSLSPPEWIERIVEWSRKYPLYLLEDMLAQEDWANWSDLTSKFGSKMLIVGDDLLTTNIVRIQKAIETKACNSVLIKPNQVGTVTETLSAISLAKSAGLPTIVSHRAGETNDDFIADLCVGTGSRFCKFGGTGKGERVAKYNRLLRIEEKLLRHPTD